MTHFSFPVPKMSIFSLDISALTKSSFPWFMILTFYILIVCISLQHPFFLSLLGTLATGHPFSVNLAKAYVPVLFFFLCFFPVSYWICYDLDGSSSKKHVHTVPVVNVSSDFWTEYSSLLPFVSQWITFD